MYLNATDVTDIITQEAIGSMGNCIKELLTERNWTQRDLAVRIEKPESHLNKIISGEVSPNLTTARLIADAFGVAIERAFPSDNGATA